MLRGTGDKDLVDPRVIVELVDVTQVGGHDPIEMGRNDSGRGVGASMVRHAGSSPRFHPSDFRTFAEDGVGADCPISYLNLRSHYCQIEAELPVAGQSRPWGDPHSPHPIGAPAAAMCDEPGDAAFECGLGP